MLTVSQRKRIKEVQARVAKLQAQVIQYEAEELIHLEHVERLQKCQEAARREVVNAQAEIETLNKEFDQTQGA